MTSNACDYPSDSEFELSIFSLAVRLKMTMAKEMYLRYLCYTRRFRGAHNERVQMQWAKYHWYAPSRLMILIKRISMWDLSAINIDVFSDCVICVLRLCKYIFSVYSIIYMPSKIINTWAPNVGLQSFLFPSWAMFAFGMCGKGWNTYQVTYFSSIIQLRK
jgi:hypothetical protein